MLTLNTVIDIGILKIILVLKYTFYIICVLLPIIFLFICIKNIIKFIIDPSKASKTIQELIYKLIFCLMFFFIPTLISYAFTLIEEYDDSKISTYYNNATLDKIKELEREQKSQIESDKAATQADLKEATAKKIQEQQKTIAETNRKKEQQQLENTQQQNQNNNNNSSSSSTNNTSQSTSTEPYYEGTFTGNVDSSCGKRAQNQIITYNGQALGQDSKITIKKGETITLKVNVTQSCGTVKQLTRTTADGQSDWRNYLSQSSQPYVNRNDSSTFKNTDTYNWVITGNKVTQGHVIISQTSTHSTTNFNEIKSMIRIRIQVTN